jgi:hypothetical protein
VLYLLLIAVPLTLAWRLREEPRWRPLAGLLAGAALASGAILVIFVSGAAAPWDGTMQRLGVSLPLAGLIAVAWVNWHNRPRSPRSRRAGRTPAAPESKVVAPAGKDRTPAA